MKLTILSVVCAALAFSSSNAAVIEQKYHDTSADGKLEARLRPGGGFGGFGGFPGSGAGGSNDNSGSSGDSGSSSNSGESCSTYVIINTRGTGEIQGPSVGFRTMNSQIMSQIPGGSIYNTRYPADFSQNSAQGTSDIVNKVSSTLNQNPNTCFLLEGYSQGAAATVNALSKLNGNSFDAVKGVFLIGDPCRRAGLPPNVDPNGGTSTKNSNGLQSALCGIPQNWYTKTLDVCALGDSVCQIGGATAAHLSYGFDAATQNLGTKFGTTVLKGGTYSH
ncbi:unnamed protein product [Sympodiomycopsis kandeliae]